MIKIAAWLIGVGLLIAVGTSILGTVGSVVTAPGRVIQKTLQTDNIIQSYEWFYDVNAAYNAKIGQVTQFKGFMSNEEDKVEKRKLRIEMAAIQQVCRTLTEKYNANSEKMNKSIFKGWSLPVALNQQTCN